MGDGPAVGRVRAYVALGANLGDTAGHARGRGPRPRLPLPGATASAACRGSTPRRPSALIDQPEFRNAVVALDVPGRTRRRGRARRPCWSRSRTSSARSGDRRASAGARARSTSTCSCSATPSIEVERPPAGPQRRPGQGDAPADRPARRGAEPPVRAGAPGRPRARPRAARLGRDGRRGGGAPPGGGGRGRGPADRDLGRRGLAADRADGLEADGRRAVPIEHVDRVDEPDLLALVRHHQRMRPGAAAEEPDALEQLAGRNAGRREHELVARRPGPRSGRPGPRRRGRASSTPSRAPAPRRCGTGTGPGSRRPGSAARPR